MKSQTVVRKPKLHFDTGMHPDHVTFDDGKAARRSLPWSNFVEACWDHGEPNLFNIEMGAWLIVICGHNLGPLFAAVEDHSLTRLRAQPELRRDHKREPDTFVTEIRFTTASACTQGVHPGEQIEFDLVRDEHPRVSR